MIENKPIIIDGIDVSICERHCSDNHNRPNRCYSDITESYRDCRPKENQCNFYITSIEKQLSRKTQRCEELDNEAQNLFTEKTNLEIELKQAEQKLELIRKKVQAYIDDEADLTPKQVIQIIDEVE